MPAIGFQILAIAHLTRCNVFVESGTYEGESFGKAIRSGVFERCYSVEIDPALYQRAAARFPATPKQQVFLGKSYESFVKDIFPRCSAEDRIFFWLDGHFSAGVTGGAEYPCPLADELRVIRESCPTKSVVIAIDDTDDLGRRDPGVQGLNWPTRAELEAAVDSNLTILDYTGAGATPKIGRGLLIFSYMPPGDIRAAQRLLEKRASRQQQIMALRQRLSRLIKR